MPKWNICIIRNFLKRKTKTFLATGVNKGITSFLVYGEAERVSPAKRDGTQRRSMSSSLKKSSDRRHMKHLLAHLIRQMDIFIIKFSVHPKVMDNFEPFIPQGSQRGSMVFTASDLLPIKRVGPITLGDGTERKLMNRIPEWFPASSTHKDHFAFPRRSGDGRSSSFALKVVRIGITVSVIP